MDRLQSMRVFAKVVEHGSFARAAVALDMSNTVVTRNVADLEAHLGTRLLNRTTRRLSLTETGRDYLERVLQILGDVDDADAIASSSGRTASGTLRIFCQTSFGQSQLGRLLPLYAKSFPNVLVDVTLSDHNVDLVGEGYDIGILLNVQKFDASMIARLLASSNVVLCASPGYVARHGEPATPIEIAQHQCLNFSMDLLRHSWPVHWDDKEISVPIQSRMVSNNGAVLRQAALADMGIMIRSSFTLEDDFSSGRLVQLLKGHNLGKLKINLVYPSRRLLSAKVRTFVEFMCAQFPHPEADPWLSTV